MSLQLVTCNCVITKLKRLHAQQRKGIKREEEAARAYIKPLTATLKIKRKKYDLTVCRD